MARHQSRLWAFVFSVVAEPHAAADVFQETNRVLWEKAGQFDEGREFLPWAFAIARNQARAARQARQRERLAFDSDVVERIADRAAERAESIDERQVALAECLRRLPVDQRELLERRYGAGEPLRRIADALGRTVGALGVAVFRIRRVLARCIDGVLAGATSR